MNKIYVKYLIWYSKLTTFWLLMILLFLGLGIPYISMNLWVYSDFNEMFGYILYIVSGLSFFIGVSAFSIVLASGLIYPQKEGMRGD